MNVEGACELCSSSDQPVFHSTYSGLCYSFPIRSRPGVETRARRKQREEMERLERGRNQKYGDDFKHYAISDIDDINCVGFLTVWLFAIPTSNIETEADIYYNDYLAQQILYRINCLEANM